MNLFNQVKPHLIAILAFVIVSCLYFSPSLSGKKMNAHDNVGFTAANKECADYKAKGETILWTNRIFSGMPLFQTSYAIKSNLVGYVGTVFSFFSYEVNILIYLMIGMYFALLLFNLKSKSSIPISIAYGLTTWYLLSIEAGHNSKMFAIAYVPLLLGGMYHTYFTDSKKGLIAIGIGLALLIGTSHYQIVYYAIIMTLFMGIYALIEFIKSNRIADFAKRTGIILFVVAVAVGCNTTNLWTNSEYVKETMRGGNSELTKTSAPGVAEKKSTGLDINYAFSWSYGIIESMNMIIPNLMGGGSNQEMLTADSEIGKKYGQDEYIQLPTYWGEQPFTSGPTYIGGLIFIFFIFFMLVEQNKIKWFFLATVLLSLMLAWGRHFLILNEFLFNHLPIYNKFRTPSMALTIATISLYFTGGWFFSKLINGEYGKELLAEKFKTLAYIVGGFALFAFYLGVSGLDFKSATADARILEQNKDFPIADLIADRKMLMMNDTYRFIMLMAVSLGLIWAFVFEKMKNAQYFMIGMSLIMVVDVWSVGKRYVNTKDYSEATSFEEFIPSTPADLSILNDKSGQFRVFNSTNDPFNDNAPGFYHSNVGGYSAAKLYRYQDIIERHLSRGNMAVFNMLNTKYFITQGQEQGAPPQAQQNPGACGNAWFVREIKFAKNADEEMSLMENFDPKNTVIIDERYKADVKPISVDSLSAAMNSIALAKYHPDKMEYTTNASAEQFAVFSEIWYRGNEDWKAYIDGKETKMTRVNYLLRGMNIPAGKHEIVFEFKPDCYYKGNIYGYASSILFYLMCIGIFYTESKRKEN